MGRVGGVIFWRGLFFGFFFGIQGMGCMFGRELYVFFFFFYSFFFRRQDHTRAYLAYIRSATIAGLGSLYRLPSLPSLQTL